MKPILFVRCEPWDTFGVAPEAVRAAGGAIRVWDAHDPGASRPDLEAVDGVVLYGSSFNVEHVDQQPFIKEVRELALEAVEGETPFLGVCFGAQILAWALEAEVRKAPNREFGFERVYPEPASTRDPLLAHYADGDMVFQWHMDTFVPPLGAEVLATGNRVLYQAFRMGPLAWGVQWHLEVDGHEIDSWLKTFAAQGDLRAEWGKSEDDVRREAASFLPAHMDKGRELVRRFVGVVRETAG